MNLKSNVLIVSVFQKAINQNQNVDSHIQIVQTLKSTGIPFVELTGKYEGSEELSILIEGFEHRELVEKIAKTFNQECYLESHNDRATFLVFPDGSKKSIGTLTPVSKAEAENAGSYSYNGVVDQYFVTR